MTGAHELEVTTQPGGLLFTCVVDGCGRRMAIDREGRYSVIDRGDATASHRGGVGGVELDLPQVRMT
ncbi:hypothetical protein FHX44_111246 [Pseudonocardia hierapolitana]|uniref:Uncharacterized protein n=1 Tax=Pseudonocardia hierapolitana TaxID=1128676 RepID=A0A561SKM2_9PSEU|nr:hypothetical protein [Pseudonocardia hierapolitana]TWF75362.1 hypothetical protein FHX44_111246 [Pseudonocardia hierapolitana]